MGYWNVEWFPPGETKPGPWGSVTPAPAGNTTPAPAGVTVTGPPGHYPVGHVTRGNILNVSA